MIFMVNGIEVWGYKGGYNLRFNCFVSNGMGEPEAINYWGWNVSTMMR